jgi:protein-S-isoprenylcysteine O-methyltransferase Ste14
VKALELKVPPLAVVIIASLIMWGIEQITPSIDIAWSWRITLGILVFGISILFLSLSILSFKKARTTLTPLAPERANSLVQSGVFAISRNPIYLALLIFLLSFAIVLANAYSLSGLLVFYIYLTQFQIKPEERVLKKLFGAEYEEYLTRVRRWL